MAVEMFLRLDGVTGGSQNYGHKGWAEVLTWSWDLDRVQGASEANPDSGLKMNEISLVKAVSVDSAAIMTLFAGGTAIKSAEIDIVPVVGKRDAQQKYITITLEEVLIKSISTGGSVDESVFKEKITLAFGKMKYEFHHYADVGPAGGVKTLTSYAFGWDLNTHTAR